MVLDVGRVLDRLRGHPDVTGLHAGPLGTIVTPTAAGPVVGVRMDTAMIVLGIEIGPGAVHEDVAAGVRARISAVAPGLPVSLSFRKVPARAPAAGPA